MLNLRLARLDERSKIYDWMACSDLTPSFLGPPNFPEHPIPTYSEFVEDYKDFYFKEEGKERGGTFIIECKGNGSSSLEELGSATYSNFHLQPDKSELDIWLKCSAACGKGVGPAAILLLTEKLHNELGVSEFLIRPSERNLRAVRAYSSAGFQNVSPANKEKILRTFLLPEYWDLYGAGDYGPEATAVMTLSL